MSDAAIARLFIDESIGLLDQSMLKIRHCLGQLTTEQIWWRPHESGNSIGNLVLHLCGNLRQWICAGMGGSEDRRERASEFSTRESLDAAELLALADTTVGECRQVLARLDEAELLRQRTIQGFQLSGLQAISHTTTHFVGHTHQIIFITRLLLGERYQFHWTPDSPRGQVPV